MSKLVGVSDVQTVLGSLKRTALAFDEIALWNLEVYRGTPLSLYASQLSDLEWLIDIGLVVEASPPSSDDELTSALRAEAWRYYQSSNFTTISRKLGELLKKMEPLIASGEGLSQEIYVELAQVLQALGLTDRIESLSDADIHMIVTRAVYESTGLILPADSRYALMQGHASRLVAADLVARQGVDAVPLLLSRVNNPPPKGSSNIEVVVETIVRNLPVPHEDTPWEAIIDFRSDPQSKYKYLALRQWVRELANSPLTGKELEDKLEWLIADYEQHMRIHRMKYRRSALETVVTGAADVIENALKLRLGKLVKGIFSYREQRVALLEAEMKTPGREIAYIVAARENFG